MKKRTVIALIAAAVLIVVGGMILTLGLSFAGSGSRESSLTRQEVIVKQSFDSIVIDTDTCDVSFAMFSGREDCMVVFRTHERIKHDVTVEDETLKIQMLDERSWIDHIGIFNLFGSMENMEITVYLPAAEYEALQAITKTGDIHLGQEPLFREVVLRSATGDIRYADAVCEMLDCMSSTGDVLVSGVKAQTVKLVCTTGDIRLTDVEGEVLRLENTTGDKDLENVVCKQLICESNTGEVELENSDAGSVDIQTDTGDVSGRFLTPKWFSAHSDTGNVTVPHTRDGGECRIESNTGDIHFQ